MNWQIIRDSLPNMGDVFWGNSIKHYLIALAIYVGTLFVLRIFRKYFLNRIRSYARGAHKDVAKHAVHVIDAVPSLLYSYISLYVALRFLTLNQALEGFLDAVLLILVFYWATKAVLDLLEFFFEKSAKRDKKSTEEKTAAYFALNLLVRIVLWTTAILLILSNLGINITALAASLGIGGVAIALAVQNILGDLFSSFSIYLDKPFEIGDFIVVGPHKGNVKKIGLKTTRILSIQGEEIVISNRELTSARIQNFKKMKQRRAEFLIGVTYQTPPSKLKKIPKVIQSIYKKVRNADLERVNLKEFGPSSLNFEVVYYVKSNDYIEYMKIQERINLAIIEAFTKEKIEFAYPTQTVFVQGVK